MMKRIFSLLLLFYFLSPAFVMAYTVIAGPKNVAANGSLQSQTAFEVVLVDTQGNSVPDQQLNFAAPNPDAQVVTAPQLVRLKFSDDHVGFQAIIVSTNNRMQGAKPRFSPQFRSATGSGLVGKAEVADANTNHGAHAGEKITAAPLQWTVFDQLVKANEYVMVGDPRIEFYVIDKQQAVATEADTSDDPGTQPPPPFDSVVGAALIVGGISDKNAFIADAPRPSGTGEHRLTSDGEVFVKMAANYRDQIGQGYGTSTLTFELVTM